MADQALMDVIAAMQGKLIELQQKVESLENPRLTNPTNPANAPLEAAHLTTHTSRRRLLGKLGAAMVTGIALNSAISSPQAAQARLIADSIDDNGDRKIGAIIVPPGTPTPVGHPPPPVFNTSTPQRYGLVATDGADTTFTLANLPGTGTGVYGNGLSFGIYGNSNNNTGIFGNGKYTGVYGGGGTFGVYGKGSTYGVYGISNSTTTANTGYGVTGIGYFTGVYAENISSPDRTNPPRAFLATSGFAADFYGDVRVNGTLSKSGGSFKIDHPHDPANKYLSHSFVESPDMMNIYNEVIRLDNAGAATVELPGWFESLNRDFRYQLTPLGSSSPDLYISEEVKGGKFKIAGGKPGQRVSWQITGIRQDQWANAHRIPVEEDKPAAEKGFYMHPSLFGAGEEQRIGPKPPVVPAPS